MTTRSIHDRRRRLLGVVTPVAVLLAACSGGGDPTPAPQTIPVTDQNLALASPTPAPTPPPPQPPADATGAAAAPDAGLPTSHVHGIAVDPADDTVYLATHHGLFRVDPTTGTSQVGPVIDLMGFSVAGPGTFYSSGHPGPGTPMPNPVGLLRSTDAGQSWQPLSRQGQSDFHAMTAAPFGILAIDDTLRFSPDGLTWQERELPITGPQQPIAIAAAPAGAILLATTDAGPLRSTDQGRTWSPIPTAPLLQWVTWADASTAVGVTADGNVHLSTDAGLTWKPRASTGPAQAITATITDGRLRILIVTDTQIIQSTDNAATFTPWPVS